MPRTRDEAACHGSYTYNPSIEPAHLSAMSSPVADLTRKRHCNLKCKWATEKPSCIRPKKSLEAYFKKHGKFNIVRREYADEYPECPLYEPRNI